MTAPAIAILKKVAMGKQKKDTAELYDNAKVQFRSSDPVLRSAIEPIMEAGNTEEMIEVLRRIASWSIRQCKTPQERGLRVRTQAFLEEYGISY